MHSFLTQTKNKSFQYIISDFLSQKVKKQITILDFYNLDYFKLKIKQYYSKNIFDQLKFTTIYF